MVVLGIDAHKRTHTAVAVDDHGKRLGSTTVAATSAGNLELVRWASQFGEHTFAVEDCRHLSRRLERDLLAAGETLVRVHPKLMARVRRSARSRANPIPSTPPPSPGPPSVRRTSRPPAWMDPSETSGSWSITGRTWSTSGRGSRTGCTGTSMSSIRPSN